MATKFTTATAWKLVAIDPERERGGRIPSGASGEAASGYEWVRDQYTVILYRIGIGLSAYAPRIGEEVTGDKIEFVGGADAIAANSSFTYKCIDNPLQPEVEDAGIWRETIVWRWESQWYQAAVSSEDSPYSEDG